MILQKKAAIIAASMFGVAVLAKYIPQTNVLGINYNNILGKVSEITNTVLGETKNSPKNLRQQPEKTFDYYPASLSDRPEQLLYKYAYTVSYNWKTKEPNWVAWHLTSQHINGSYSRRGQTFTADKDVMGIPATTFDYNRSGYDRGHMCPSGDNKWSKTAQEQCFLMSNICPQVHALNAGDWEELEEKCRSWASEYGDIYIVCGPIFSSNNLRKIGKTKIAVPDAFFKVVLCMKKPIKAIGFIFKNKDINDPLLNHAYSVDAIEKATGIDFFHALPDNIEQAVEAKDNYSDWN